jgi:syntaxin-binding protein 1
MPTSANIDRIIRDFSGGRQQYAGAHLFFVDGASPSGDLHRHSDASANTALAEELFQRLTSSPAEPFLRGLQDLYINFWGGSDLFLLQCTRHSAECTALSAMEAQAFSLRVPEHFFSMYSPPRSDATARPERDRVEEDIRFLAKSVRVPARLCPLPHSCMYADRECVYHS